MFFSFLVVYVIPAKAGIRKKISDANESLFLWTILTA